MIRKAHNAIRFLSGVRRLELNPGSITSVVAVPITPAIRAQLARAASQRYWSGVIIIPPAGEGPPAKVARFGRKVAIFFDPSRSPVDALRVMIDKLDVLEEAMRAEAQEGEA